MKNLQDWPLSSCISNWNDLETHSTRSRPVYSLQTSTRGISWSARQKQHTHWGHVEGLLRHGVSIAPPMSGARLNPSIWLLCSPADSSSNAGPAPTTASLMSDAANQLSDKQTLPDLSASIIPAASVGTLSDREHVGQYHRPGSLPHTFWNRLFFIVETLSTKPFNGCMRRVSLNKLKGLLLLCYCCRMPHSVFPVRPLKHFGSLHDGKSADTTFVIHCLWLESRIKLQKTHIRNGFSVRPKTKGAELPPWTSPPSFGSREYFLNRCLGEESRICSVE